jgi:hypothetical protein
VFDQCSHFDSAIVSHFKTHFEIEQEERSRGEEPSNEVMSRWLSSRDDDQFEELPTQEIIDGKDDLDGEEEINIVGLEEYRKFILDNPTYVWLLDQLRREVLLSRAEPDIMHEISEAILDASRSRQRVSRKVSPLGCKAVFRVDWDPFLFLEEQGFDAPNFQVITRAITLTGSCKDAQALSCRDYLAQTWGSAGTRLIDLIQELVRNGEHGRIVTGRYTFV